MSQTALITGSATRIGGKIVEYLVSNKWNVIIHCNNSYQDAQNLQRKYPLNIYIKQTNLQNPHEVKKLISSINEEVGEINLLVNNAAIFENDNIDNFTIENFNNHIQVNLLAPLILIQEFKKQYQGNAGNIINMLDYSVMKLPDKFLSYNISKSGLWAATQMLAQMLAPNIRVNAIGPGPTLPSENQSEKNFQQAYHNTLLNRGCTLEEICRTIDYIVNTPSLTGQIIMLDSGRHISNFEYN